MTRRHPRTRARTLAVATALIGLATLTACTTPDDGEPIVADSATPSRTSSPSPTPTPSATPPVSADDLLTGIRSRDTTVGTSAFVESSGDQTFEFPGVTTGTATALAISLSCPGTGDWRVTLESAGGPVGSSCSAGAVASAKIPVADPTQPAKLTIDVPDDREFAFVAAWVE